jgi:hypothetical protein
MTTIEAMLLVEFCIEAGVVLADKICLRTSMVKAATDNLFHLALVKVYAGSK